jgi:apolipoprotein N-acyltransferase
MELASIPSDSRLTKAALFRTSIAIATMVVFNLVQFKIFPMGMPLKRMLLPLLVTYAVLGLSVGVAQKDNAGQAATHGALVGLLVFGIISVWLKGVGFFGMGGMFTNVLLGAGSVALAGAVTFEVSKAVNNAPSSSK